MKTAALFVGAILLIIFIIFAVNYFIYTAIPHKLSKPWQVKIHPDNSSEIFDLVLDKSTLLAAKQNFSQTAKYALIKNNKQQNSATLEVYIEKVNFSGIMGKLVLVFDKVKVNEDEWQIMQHTANNEKFIRLEEQDTTVYDSLTIFSITLVPDKNLDEEIIMQTFGAPDEKIQAVGVSHWLYPKIGVAIALHQKSKEVIQYVAPGRFDLLRLPLLRS